MLNFLLNLISPPEPFRYVNPNPPQIEIKRPVRREPTSEEMLACSCVKYVREFIPSLPRGDARDLPRNGYIQEGGVVLFKTHMGYISRMWGNTIEVKHRYLKRISDTEFTCITTTDQYGYGDPRLRGFWNPKQKPPEGD